MKVLMIMTKVNYKQVKLYNKYCSLPFMINNQAQPNKTLKKKNLFDDDESQQVKAGKYDKKLVPKVPEKSSPVILNGVIIEEQGEQQQKDFSDFGLQTDILRVLKQSGYEKPTKIQSMALSYSLKQVDMLCLSETGSGKTLSFLLPIINSLRKLPKQQQNAGFALIMAPTRQLCIQIQDYLIKFRQHGLTQCTSVVLHGGVDTKMKQVLELTKKPCIIIGTPGRILDHLQNTKGFNLNKIKYLVLDQADKLLNLDFEKQINQILQILPKQRIAYLYSATLTSKVEKLQRVSLNNPVRIEVNSKYRTVSKLEDSYIFIPAKWKDCYLVYLLKRFKDDRIIIFGKTCLGVERIFLVLRELKFSVDCLHGDLSQPQRIKALQNFKQKKCRILVCTDVAARGIDVTDINMVINYDLCCPKDYIHRVGRTARIGKEGKAISIITQYDVETFQQIQKKLGKTIPELPTQETEALVYLELLDKYHQEVSRKMRQNKKNKNYE